MSQNALKIHFILQDEMRNLLVLSIILIFLTTIILIIKKLGTLNYITVPIIQLTFAFSTESIITM